MVKSGIKTSASSATRKKHARKAAVKDGPPTDVPNLPKDKKPKGKDKGKIKEPPRKKAYVQPVKPQPVQQDPIDALGLAQRLPPELLVVLRGLSKKDTVTKTKALEELRVGWIDRVHLLSDSDDQDADAYARLDALTLSLPIWVRSILCLRLSHIITHSDRKLECGYLPEFLLVDAPRARALPAPLPPPARTCAHDPRRDPTRRGSAHPDPLSPPRSRILRASRVHPRQLVHGRTRSRASSRAHRTALLGRARPPLLHARRQRGHARTRRHADVRPACICAARAARPPRAARVLEPRAGTRRHRRAADRARTAGPSPRDGGVADAESSGRECYGAGERRRE